MKWALFYLCLGWAVFYARMLWFLYGQLPQTFHIQPPGPAEILEGIFYLIFVGLLPVAASGAFLTVKWPEQRKLRAEQ
jgi:hypothetical protein